MHMYMPPDVHQMLIPAVQDVDVRMPLQALPLQATKSDRARTVIGDLVGRMLTLPQDPMPTLAGIPTPDVVDSMPATADDAAMQHHLRLQPRRGGTATATTI